MRHAKTQRDGQGPFVMNTRQEIVQAIQDFNSWHFGTLGNTQIPS